MNYKKLVDLLKEKNLSDNKIARIIDMTGTGYRDMLKNHTMKVDTLEKVAKHFNTPVSYFFDEQEPEVQEPPAGYKTNGCKLCEEKEKRIELLEKMVAMLELKGGWFTHMVVHCDSKFIQNKFRLCIKTQ